MKKYDVGYAKPPKHSQFKPGKSGNPSGRPRGSRNTYTIFEKLLSEKVLITKDGQKIRITKREALLIQAINSGLKNNAKSIGFLFPHMLAIDAKNEERAAAIETLRQDNKKIIEQFLKRNTDEQTNS